MSDKEYQRMITEMYLEKSRPATIEDIYTDNVVCILLPDGRWQAHSILNGDNVKEFLVRHPFLWDKIRTKEEYKLLNIEWYIERGFTTREEIEKINGRA